MMYSLCCILLALFRKSSLIVFVEAHSDTHTHAEREKERDAASETYQVSDKFLLQITNIINIAMRFAHTAYC